MKKYGGGFIPPSFDLAKFNPTGSIIYKSLVYIDLTFFRIITNTDNSYFYIRLFMTYLIIVSFFSHNLFYFNNLHHFLSFYLFDYSSILLMIN